jgi:hypothetical protein
MKIYLVIHSEVSSSGHVDEMVFYTTSSIEKALDLIKKSRVDLGTWWEIQEQDLDGSEWPTHVGWYGRNGGKLKTKPRKRESS